MPVISVSMPESLVEDIDEFAERHGYSGRSEAVREGTRRLLQELSEPELADRDVACVVTTTFEHDSGAEAQLSTLRHDYDGLVASNVHSHAGGACLEVFVVEGHVDEVRSYVARLRSIDGVTSVEFTIVSPSESLDL